MLCAYLFNSSLGLTQVQMLCDYVVETTESTACNLLEVGFLRESDFKLPLRNLLGHGESSFRFSLYIKSLYEYS